MLPFEIQSQLANFFRKCLPVYSPNVSLATFLIAIKAWPKADLTLNFLANLMTIFDTLLAYRTAQHFEFKNKQIEEIELVKEAIAKKYHDKLANERKSVAFFQKNTIKIKIDGQIAQLRKPGDKNYSKPTG